MSSSSDNPGLQDQLPLTVEYPEDDKEFKEKLYNVNQRTAAAVNTKVGGLYVPTEKITGAQYSDPNNPQQNKNVYRITINFGALPNSTTKTVSHGITWDINFRLVNLYGAANDVSNMQGLTLPNDGILLRIDSSNVIITTTANYSDYSESTVVIEYTKG